jgi:hypothetical protein
MSGTTVRPGQWYACGRWHYQVLVISVTRDHVTYLLFNHQALTDRALKTPRRNFHGWLRDPGMRVRRIA